MGLVVAMKRYAATFAATFDVDCQVLVEGTPHRLDRDIEIGIYRIIQSALQNVINHASASRAWVAFSFSPASLKVTITDDGTGFDPKIALETPGDHLGLLGMKERVEGMGARLIVISSPDDGTQVELHLPNPEYLDE
jgi:two-component system sensor histidine kinase DegS